MSQPPSVTDVTLRIPEWLAIDGGGIQRWGQLQDDVLEEEYVISPQAENELQPLTDWGFDAGNAAS
ncbi:hypothetical protein HYDPIDRAFT_107311 [Hydnomerulius pinastri MD-312]|nr:hypothetical protein HYDPIDRAFT_107311 [Hydnomerulius pinastri MD-312]